MARLVDKDISKDIDVNLSIDYASDAIRNVNKASWWNDPIHLESARINAERLLYSIKAAQRRFKIKKNVSR
jgi:hypothetical protein